MSRRLEKYWIKYSIKSFIYQKAIMSFNLKEAIEKFNCQYTGLVKYMLKNQNGRSIKTSSLKQ